METKWAEENLKTIRTLMERTALYRRAMGPIMIFCGIVGVAGGLLGWATHIDSIKGFVGFWGAAAAIGLGGSFFLIRRQALKDSEPFWSLPTRRVAQALLPPFVIGLAIGSVLIIWGQGTNRFDQAILVMGWTWLFGCAIHSAGFFMPRGIRWLGWIFIAAGCGLLACIGLWPQALETTSPHLLMGGIFGGLHLAYGLYVHFTEKRGNES